MTIENLSVLPSLERGIVYVGELVRLPSPRGSLFQGPLLLPPSSRTFHNFFVRSPIDGHFGCFLVLANVNNAAGNTEVQISLGEPVFIALGCEPRSGPGESDSQMVAPFVSSAGSPVVSPVAAPCAFPVAVCTAGLCSPRVAAHAVCSTGASPRAARGAQAWNPAQRPPLRSLLQLLQEIHLALPLSSCTSQYICLRTFVPWAR